MPEPICSWCGQPALAPRKCPTCEAVTCCDKCRLAHAATHVPGKIGRGVSWVITFTLKIVLVAVALATILAVAILLMGR